VAAVGAGARHFVEAQLGAGGDDQVVVVQRSRRRPASGGFAVGIDARHGLGNEVDALALQQRAIGIAPPSRLRQPTATQGLDGVNWK
jgi:hypothetical protein